MNPDQQAIPPASVTIQAPKPKLWLLQFRLRELLLGMIALSALLMVVVQNIRSLRPSAVYSALSVASIDGIIKRLATEHGLSKVDRGGGVAGGGSSSFVRDSSSLDYAIPVLNRALIKKQLRQNISKKIVECGAQEESAATAGDSFTFNYICGKRAGMIYIAFFSVSPEIWRINCVFVESVR